jgi:N-sulfoglucosamine sulfohydrolase
VLRERGLLDNTLIIFTGDNGAALPHGKGSLYDPGVNVPLIIRWPGAVNAASESHVLVSGEDIAPTMLEAAGMTPHPRMSGVSFLPLLKGEPYASRKHEIPARLNQH